MPFIPAIVGAALIGAAGTTAAAVISSKSASKSRKAAEKAADRQAQIAEDQLKEQKRIQDKVEGALTRFLAGGEGFSEEELALLQTQFLGENNLLFNQAETGANAALRARTGDLPAGGDFGRTFAGLLGQKATARASGINDIRLRDAQQALINQFNAAQIIQKGGSLLNPAAFSGLANQSLANAALYGQIGNTGLGAALGGIASSLGGLLGSREAAPWQIPMGGSMGGYNPPPPFDPLSGVPGASSTPFPRF